jgi:hypothetical protein
MKRDVNDTLKAEGIDAVRARSDRAKRYNPQTNGDGKTAPPLLQSSAQFIAGFTPPDYVVSGVLQRSFLYAMTGKTGAGKTAILLLLAAHVAEGRPIGDHDIEKGPVLYFAGENPGDACARWIAMSQQIDFDAEAIEVFFIPGVFKISAMHDRIRNEVAAIGGVSLVVVDTSAAFFEGNDENDNKEHGDHARRLRTLTTLPGRPCVITACHPVKNATDENLQPRGGGAFLAEIDGNLTACTTAGGVEVSTQGKFRGPDFPQMHFQLRTVTHERLKDSKGRLIPTVVAAPLSEQAREEIAKVTRSKEDQLLVALLDPTNCKASKVELARLLGWTMSNGDPYRVLVGRSLRALQNAKLLTLKRGVITLTKEGKKEAEQACSRV